MKKHEENKRNLRQKTATSQFSYLSFKEKSGNRMSDLIPMTQSPILRTNFPVNRKTSSDHNFIPKNVIFCLSIRKLFTESSTRFQKFSFCLIRSLYKEWKIQQSPSPKRNSSRQSLKYTAKPKKNYSKDSESKIVQMFRSNKAKLAKNKCFFVWQNLFKAKRYLKMHAAKKVSQCLTMLIRKTFKEIRVKSEANLKKRTSFKGFVDKFSKKLIVKVVKIMILNAKIKQKTSFKMFTVLIKPRHVFPIFMNGLKNKKAESVSLPSSQKNSNFRLKQYSVAFRKVFRLNLSNIVPVRKALEKIRKFVQSQRSLQRTSSAIRLFSILDFCFATKKKQEFFEKLENAALRSLEISKAVVSLIHTINAVVRKNKTMAFTKVLMSPRKNNGKNIIKGANIVARVMKYKVLNVYYCAFTMIKTAKIHKNYRKRLVQCAGLFNYLEKKFKSYTKIQLKSIYSDLKSNAKVQKYHEGLSELFILLKSILNKNHFKCKIISFNAFSNFSKPVNKKKFIKYISAEYLFKKLYIKKLAYSFL